MSFPDPFIRPPVVKIRPSAEDLGSVLAASNRTTREFVRESDGLRELSGGITRGELTSEIRFEVIGVVGDDLVRKERRGIDEAPAVVVSNFVFIAWGSWLLLVGASQEETTLGSRH
jgi:hypothetical protein